MRSDSQTGIICPDENVFRFVPRLQRISDHPHGNPDAARTTYVEFVKGILTAGTPSGMR